MTDYTNPAHVALGLPADDLSLPYRVTGIAGRWQVEVRQGPSLQTGDAELAKRVYCMLQVVFEAGKVERSAELRKLLGARP
jgi:hypothetical protein